MHSLKDLQKSTTGTKCPSAHWHTTRGTPSLLIVELMYDQFWAIIWI